jgi:serine/threonine protein kinase
LAVHICVRVLGALAYAHEADDNRGHPLEIVHRNISPHSIFVTNSGLVKLDFGIARARSNEGRTSAGLIEGKVAYLAPEQARYERVDRRVDIWSVGVVFWEMLSGRRLFEAESEAATLRATLEAEVPAIGSLRGEAQSKLDRIVRRALQRDPDLRYKTATEMKAELDDYLAALRQPPNKEALAELMTVHFPREIREQHLTIANLVDSNQRQPGSVDAPGEPTGLGDSENAGRTSAAMGRIGGPMHELTIRDRTVLNSLLVSLFALVAVSTFLVGVLVVHQTRQNLHRRHIDNAEVPGTTRFHQPPGPIGTVETQNQVTSNREQGAVHPTLGATTPSSSSRANVVAPANSTLNAVPRAIAHPASVPSRGASKMKKQSPSHDYGI